jgi:DNA-binding CsgD family transcriptional regulator
MSPPSALLERDQELATIEQVLRSADGGAGGLLTIEGEAGAGKTALLKAAAQQGEDAEMRVLYARGGEFERDFPYGVVRQLFEPLLVSVEKREALLHGSAAAAMPVFEPAAAPSEGADPFAIQLGLQQMVLALAESKPLLMLVDDSQWADLASLRALAYIGRRLGGHRAALALTVRKGEPGEHEPLLNELRREPNALTIEPPSLSVTAVSALLAERGPDSPGAELAAACRAATAGNPFLLVELMQALDLGHVDGSAGDAERLAELAAAGASRTILARLARLGEAAAATARAIAVMEPNAEARRVATLGGLPLDSVADACERLVVAGLLSDTQPVAFVHPLVRAAVLNEIPAPRRAADHARAARLLSADGASADAVAAHLLLSEPGGEEWVAAELRSAAAEALGRGAPAAAVSYLRRALREPPPKSERLATSRELGVALLRADEPEGIEVLRAIRGALDDPLERASIAADLSVSLAFRRSAGEGVALLEESLDEVSGTHPELAQLLRGHLLIQTLSGLEGLPPHVMPERESWPDGDTQPGRFLLRQLSYLYAIGYGPVDCALELAARTGTDRDLYAKDVRDGLPAGYVFVAQALADRGDLTPGLTAVAIESSKQRGAIPAVASAHGIRAVCRYLDGELPGAEADIEIAIRLTIPSGLLVPLGAWLGGAILIAIARGEVDAAQELLDDLWQRRAPGSGIPGAFLLVARGNLRAASGRHAEARLDFISASERVGWLPYANPEVIGWRTGLALAEDALGNEDEAQQLAAEAVRLAREAGGRRGIGLTLRAQGIVTRGERGIELLREATHVLSKTRARLLHAEAQVELGAALRRAKRRREAREPLRNGLDLAHRCGAAALEERAHTELTATGARPRKAVLSGVESLTPSELRVARMAAEGKTNREIGQSLFVTTKTVETHLRHAYQKLDVERRTELSAALESFERS